MMVWSRGVVDALFVATLVALYVLLINGVRHGLIRSGASGASRQKVLLVTRIVLAGWLGLIGILAKQGVFFDFRSLPPKFAFAFIPSLVAMLVLAFSPSARRVAEALPAHWLIWPQSFRILIEIVLWQLYLQGRIAREMTFEGRNFDILVGATAPIIACIVARRGARWLVIVWNLLGIGILTNVALTGLLSAPTRFRQLITDPPTFIIAEFPYIWLPCFAVTAAYFLHIVSLRRRSGQEGL